MEEKDLTQALFDKTDALIAKHRQPKPAVFPTPLDAVMPTPPLPVLSNKVSPEDAARLLAENEPVTTGVHAASLNAEPEAVPLAQPASAPADSIWQAPSAPVDEPMLVDLPLPPVMSSLKPVADELWKENRARKGYLE